MKGKTGAGGLLLTCAQALPPQHGRGVFVERSYLVTNVDLGPKRAPRLCAMGPDA